VTVAKAPCEKAVQPVQKSNRFFVSVLRDPRHRVAFRKCDEGKHRSFVFSSGTSSTVHQSVLSARNYTLCDTHRLLEYRILRSRARRHCHLEACSSKLFRKLNLRHFCKSEEYRGSRKQSIKSKAENSGVEMGTLYFIEKGIFWKPTPPSGVSSKIDIPAFGWGSDRVSINSKVGQRIGQGRLA
jgi:hypothetical protein